MKTMDPRIWHKVAAISGVAALCLGTYGAHMFKPKNPAYKDVWHTASLYHLVHTAALVSAPLARNPNIFGGLLTTGIIAFSGTCYTVALLEDRKYSSLAPFGGFAFIAAWASVSAGVLKIYLAFTFEQRSELSPYFFSFMMIGVSGGCVVFTFVAGMSMVAITRHPAIGLSYNFRIPELCRT